MMTRCSIHRPRFVAMTITLALGLGASAQAQKPFLVEFRNNTNGTVQLAVIAPSFEDLGRLQPRENVEVDFDRGEVVRITTLQGRQLHRISISRSGTFNINDDQNRGGDPPSNDPINPTPPGPVDIEAEKRKTLDYLNGIRANPRAFARLHPTLADPDVESRPALRSNNALNQAGQRKAQWLAQNPQAMQTGDPHIMFINGQRIGMNQWMREAGYNLPDYAPNDQTNFEVLFAKFDSTRAELGNVGIEAIDSFMSEGKNGGHVMPTLGRGFWEPCTDFGIGIANSPDGRNVYISMLVGFQGDGDSVDTDQSGVGVIDPPIGSTDPNPVTSVTNDRFSEAINYLMIREEQKRNGSVQRFQLSFSIDEKGVGEVTHNFFGSRTSTGLIVRDRMSDARTAVLDNGGIAIYRVIQGSQVGPTRVEGMHYYPNGQTFRVYSDPEFLSRIVPSP